MIDDVRQAALATWAAKNLPARLDVPTTVKFLGFAEHDIQILVAVGKPAPLRHPRHIVASSTLQFSFQNFPDY
jgi:hypothetical protein